MAPKTIPSDEVQQAAFEALSNLFDKYHGLAKGTTRPLAIEILPSSLAPTDGSFYLEDEAERSIGIPKTTLLAAFLAARRSFTTARTRERTHDMGLLAETSVILLYDPEYLTAANYRKRHLLSFQQTCTSSEDPEPLDLVNKELRFLEWILTSPLHRQSKSPTLWFHRLWVLKTFVVPMLGGDTEKRGIWEASPRLLMELKTVLRAAEKHQHNYYAFQYARRVFDVIMPMDTATSALDARQVDMLKLWQTAVLSWCKSHPSDTSGWSFLLWILSKSSASNDLLNLNSETAQAVLDFALKINWKGQALWTFLRTIVAASEDDGRLLVNETVIEQTRNEVDACADLVFPVRDAKM